MTTDLTLLYGKKPIRVRLEEDGPWFAASDLYHANRKWTDRQCLSRFSPKHLRLLSFPSDAGRVNLTAVSALGAFTVAKYLGDKVDRILDAWLRRELDRLSTEHSLPARRLALLADDTLPRRPRAFDDDLFPWVELQNDHRFARRRPPNPAESALADEDTNLEPPRVQRGPSVADLIAAGEAAMAQDAAAGRPSLPRRTSRSVL